MRTHILKHIGLALLLVLPFWGCRQESVSPEENSDMVRLNLDIDIPDFGMAATKTDFVDTPSCDQLFVVVFDEADMLSEIVQATLSGSGFTVDLHTTILPRTLHFLALPSGSPLASSLVSLSGSRLDEPGFAARLASENGEAACWARRFLPSGISATTNFGQIKMVRNYAKVCIINNATVNFTLEAFRVYNASKYGMAIPFNGTKMTNTGGFKLDLFPDFVDSSTGDICSYANVNGEQGYRGFPHPSGLLRTPVMADASTYSSYLITDGTYDPEDPNDPVICDYIFETRFNPEAGNDNPYILFKGKFRGSATSTWYKADFVYDPNPEAGNEWGKHDLLPYDIIRNFAYVLTITGVIGEGYATPEEAVDQPARNNFEGSIVGTDISGVKELSSALYLSHTAIEIPRGQNTSYIDLYYRNELPKETEKNDPTGNTPNVRISVSGDNIIDTDFVNSDGTLNLAALAADGVGISESISSTDPSVADLHLKAGNWWHLRLPLDFDDGGRGTLQQTITIKNRAGLSRNCIVSVRPKYPFEIVGYQILFHQGVLIEPAPGPTIVGIPAIKPATGDVVRVNFRIPDGLPEALFPLDFKVESYATGNGPTGNTDVTRQILQPNVYSIESYKTELGSGDYRIELPISADTKTIIGEDIYDNADLGFNSFQYIRTLTWAEYSSAAIDTKLMKTFPVLLEPQYDPRDSEQVDGLGTTTVWMRQGEREATYFYYKDDDGNCTRRFAYKMEEVEDTRIVLPLPAVGDETYDGKPVYHVTMGITRNLLVSVVKDRDGSSAPNTITLAKTATQFGMSPTTGTSSVTTTVEALRVTGEKYLVTVSAPAVKVGSVTYGASEAQFYIKPVKGLRPIWFDEPSVRVLKNQTIASDDNSNLLAVCPSLTSGNLTYSLASGSIVTSNEYVEIVQSGAGYTLRGKAVNGATTVKVYAIAPEDDNYEQSYAELEIVVQQGVVQINRNEWYTTDTQYVGIFVPLSGTVTYDYLYSTYKPGYHDINLSFSSSNNSQATVQKINGVWNIIPRTDTGAGTVTLTLHAPGTDDNNDGVFGDPDHDIFLATDFTQVLTVKPSWWKVLNNDIVSDAVYAISDASDGHLMKTTHNTTSSYRDGLVSLAYRDHYMEQSGFTSTSFGGGKYFVTTDYGYTFTAGNNRYSISTGSNYLFPRGHDWSLVANISWRESDNNDGLYLNATEPSNRSYTCWKVTRTGANFTMEAWTGRPAESKGKYINYNQSGRDNKTYFDNNGDASNYNHLWKRCSSINDIVTNCGYSSSNWPSQP